MTDTPDNKQEPEKTIKPLPFTTETMEEIMKSVVVGTTTVKKKLTIRYN